MRVLIAPDKFKGSINSISLCNDLRKEILFLYPAASAAFIQPIELSLLLAAIAGGTMMISHTNDAYFWVISQFSGLIMTETYKSFSLATIVMSISVLVTVLLLSMILI